MKCPTDLKEIIYLFVILHSLVLLPIRVHLHMRSIYRPGQSSPIMKMIDKSFLKNRFPIINVRNESVMQTSTFYAILSQLIFVVLLGSLDKQFLKGIPQQ